MKFRFCGNSDCPDWVLAEINTLSKLSSVKLRLLGQIVTQGIITTEINMEKAANLFSESKLDPDMDLKACIACLKFIIISCCRYMCDTVALNSELQQLGLPREHSSSIKKVIDENKSEIVAILEKSSLKVNPLKEVAANYDPETKCSVLDLKIGENGNSKVTLSQETVNLLLDDLKDVRNKMVELKSSQVHK